MKRLVTAMFAAGLGPAAALAAPWAGGDNLATTPLSCDAKPSSPLSMPYDGGQPTHPPERKGRTIKVVDVPKLTGIGYFGATARGIAEAAQEIGTIEARTDGPAKPVADDQIAIIDAAIAHGIDGILFAANDPVAIAPVLKRALASGINVVGYDADAEPDARQWFVNQAEFNGVGKALIDALAKEAGESAAFAVVTSSFTAPNQARWIAEMSAYAEKCHPAMKWLETVEAQEDTLLSFNQATALIQKYAGRLTGIVAVTSVASPAAAEAVTEAGECGRTAIVGLGTPNAMKPYVEKDCVKSVVLWNPIDLGYAAAYVLRAAADGSLRPGDASVRAGRLGELTILNGSEVLLGAPFVFTKDNIGSFNF